MNFDILSLDGKKTGSMELSADVFGREVRKDLLARAVTWQLAAARAGLAFTKTRGEINRTKKKVYRQKGTGGARHGAKTANIFVGGGVVFGPRGREFAHNLTKKVRQLALKTAFSSKAQAGDLIILSDIATKSHKTKDLASQLEKLGASRATFIVDANDANFEKASRNLPFIKVLPTEGANVYDILRYTKLVMTENAVKMLEARLSGEGSTDAKPAKEPKAKAAKPAAKAKAAEDKPAKKAPAKKPAAKKAKAE
ncbi:MAG: 50S ribosomal protein L4 [Pseudomonadaceae bacterium]|nr:50S ribosomal protein L4 [Pseudomonadaceae bacterium]